MRFIAGVAVGTIFGRLVVRTAVKVVPQTARDKMYDKAVEKGAHFVQNRIEGALNYAERKLYGETREEFRNRRYTR